MPPPSATRCVKGLAPPTTRLLKVWQAQIPNVQFYLRSREKDNFSIGANVKHETAPFLAHGLVRAFLLRPDTLCIAEKVNRRRIFVKPGRAGLQVGYTPNLAINYCPRHWRRKGYTWWWP